MIVLSPIAVDTFVICLGCKFHYTFLTALDVKSSLRRVFQMADTRAKILIVDDDQDVLIALERVLESEGYCTATAWSGQEALELLRKAEFDLLLVDEHLPDVNPVDLFSRRHDTRHQPYCFLMSPTSPQADRAEPLPRPGIHASVCKWEHDAIAAKIRSYLPA